MIEPGELLRRIREYANEGNLDLTSYEQKVQEGIEHFYPDFEDALVVAARRVDPRRSGTGIRLFKRAWREEEALNPANLRLECPKLYWRGLVIYKDKKFAAKILDHMLWEHGNRNRLYERDLMEKSNDFALGAIVLWCDKLHGSYEQAVEDHGYSINLRPPGNLREKKNLPELPPKRSDLIPKVDRSAWYNYDELVKLVVPPADEQLVRGAMNGGEQIIGERLEEVLRESSDWVSSREIRKRTRLSRSTVISGRIPRVPEKVITIKYTDSVRRFYVHQDAIDFFRE